MPAAPFSRPGRAAGFWFPLLDLGCACCHHIILLLSPLRPVVTLPFFKLQDQALPCHPQLCDSILVLLLSQRQLIPHSLSTSLCSCTCLVLTSYAYLPSLLLVSPVVINFSLTPWGHTAPVPQSCPPPPSPCFGPPYPCIRGLCLPCPHHC